jgi:intein/homing endonuclease
LGFNILNCDIACTTCVKSYSKKHDLKKGDQFKIKCGGIPKEYLSSAMLENVAGEDTKSMLAMLDPVTWAAQVLDWHCSDPDGSIWIRKTDEGSLGEVTPYVEEQYGHLIKQGKSAYNRDYQTIMLRCTSKRKVFRCGRQIGKSEVLAIAILHAAFTHSDYRIIVITPYQTQIEVIFNRLNKLMQSSPLTGNSVKRYVKAPNYTIELHNGSMIRGFSCTGDTEIITQGGKKLIKNITLEDNVLCLDTDSSKLNYLPVTRVFDTNFKDVYKVTLMSGHEVTVSEDHPFWIKNIGWKPLKELSIGSDVAYAVDYKQDVSTKSDTLGYLLGLLLGDGSFTAKTMADGGPRFTAKNIKIQENFENALAKLNIPWRSQIHGVTGSKEYTIYKRYPKEHARAQEREFTPITKALQKYDLIGRTSLDKFIPIELFNESAEMRHGLLKGLMETDGFVNKDGRVGFCSISRELAYGVRDLLNTFGIKASIRLKKQAGKIMPIDSEQREIHANHDLYEVNVTTKSYVKKLFDIVDLSSKDKYIECSDKVNSQKVVYPINDIDYSKIRSISFVKKDTTYDIAVGDGTNNFIANGIIIHNTAGTKSGGNADAVRGQKANMLCFDEADYLSSDDMASALAVISNYPDATVWMSSTPTGKHEKFYEQCKSHLYKEFYYPSMANPLWNQDLEDTFRQQFTDIQYTHEVLAEFGEQEQGVYQSAYIEDAMTDYRYEDQKRDPNWMYSIGVDWNDEKVGTTIAVVGYNPVDNIFRLFNRYVVSREGWTQTAAVEKIIELNRYWLPKAIYIDKGFGGVQFEVLRKYGYDSLSDKGKGHLHPDAKLHIITKQYDFGSKLTIKDPFTKQDIDKAAKPFLVEDAVRKFEQRVIQFSKHDNQLESELRGYIIDHRTISGSPVYKQGNERVGDHNLDALNLALVAYTLELSHFGKVKYESHIGFTPGFNQFNKPTNAASNPDILSRKPPQQKVERPSMNRTAVIESPSSSLDKTAGNINGQQRRLWSWPGFERDAAPPRTRLPGGIMTKRPSPPSRKKI